MRSRKNKSHAIHVLECMHGSTAKLTPLHFGKLQMRKMPHMGAFLNTSIYHATMSANYHHGSLFHAKTHEWFYILAGTPKIDVNGTVKRLRVGDFFYIAPGVPHQISAGGKPAKALIVFSPPIDEKSPDIVVMQNHI
jgi:mannose-6-phosphate isomerase-like protein (cupin superfamily)